MINQQPTTSISPVDTSSSRVDISSPTSHQSYRTPILMRLMAADGVAKGLFSVETVMSGPNGTPVGSN